MLASKTSRPAFLAFLPRKTGTTAQERRGGESDACVHVSYTVGACSANRVTGSMAGWLADTGGEKKPKKETE
jgi:hypothetical protein